MTGTLKGPTTSSPSEPASDGTKRDTPHSPKLLHYWNLTIKWFQDIRVEVRSYSPAEMHGVFYSTSQQWTSLYVLFKIHQTSWDPYLYIYELAPFLCAFTAAFKEFFPWISRYLYSRIYHGFPKNVINKIGI